MAQPGDAVGPYRLVVRLGKGAMGEVWRARDERLDRMVAVKLLPADLAADAERRARMIREARAAAAVPHPNVVTLFDVVSDGDRDVLVMELVEGQTVAELLRASGPPPLAEALGWLERIADALATAHARGILHRDMKAANVMVTAGRDVKVLDFGLAKLRGDGAPESSSIAPRLPSASASMQKIAMDETMPSDLGKTDSGSGSGTNPPDAYVTRAGALLGTPMYMAPEQITGSPPDERTEVFSVGVIAYEILSGKPPYTATIDGRAVRADHDAGRAAARRRARRRRRGGRARAGQGSGGALADDDGVSRRDRRAPPQAGRAPALAARRRVRGGDRRDRGRPCSSRATTRRPRAPATPT